MYGQPYALGCPKCGAHCPIHHVVAFADKTIGLDGYCVTDGCPNDGERVMSTIPAKQLEEGYAKAAQWDAQKPNQPITDEEIEGFSEEALDNGAMWEELEDGNPWFP